MPNPLAKLVKLLTPKRRWAQFRLATMFVVVAAICVWLAVVVNRANSQRDGWPSATPSRWRGRGA